MPLITLNISIAEERKARLGTMTELSFPSNSANVEYLSFHMILKHH